MKTIYKYILERKDGFTECEIPAGGKILHVAMHRGSLCMWVQVEDNNIGLREQRKFSVFGTGHLIPTNTYYIGTALERMAVWHVYEIK